jgi:hypothetical protein
MSRISDQITHLSVEIYHKTEEIRLRFEPNLLEMILFICRRLTDLTFSQYSSYTFFGFLSWEIRYGSSLSSTLTQLRIKVNTFDDCLYLLSGCLQSLSTLIIRINKTNRSSLKIDNTVSISAII